MEDIDRVKSVISTLIDMVVDLSEEVYVLQNPEPPIGGNGYNEGYEHEQWNNDKWRNRMRLQEVRAKLESAML